MICESFQKKYGDQLGGFPIKNLRYKDELMEGSLMLYNLNDNDTIKYFVWL